MRLDARKNERKRTVARRNKRSNFDEEPKAWITVNGNHIPVDENGKAIGGNPKALGKNSSSKKSASGSSGGGTVKTASSAVGNVVSGKNGNLRPKSEKSRVIDTSDAIEDLKKGKKGSLEGHLDEYGNLTPERQAVHDEIIHKYFKDKVPAKGQPTMIMSGGGPASGKTFVKDGAMKDFGEDTTVVIDPDDLKAELPGHKEMSKIDPEGVAPFYHEESSALAKRMHHYACENGINVVYDGTGDGSIESVKKKIQTARDAGYKVNAAYVTVDTEEALRRNRKRYADAKKKYDAGLTDIPPRLPPEDVARKTHRKVSDISAQVAGEYDEFTLYDNNVPMGQKPILIGTCKRGEEITAIKGQEKRLQNFLDKGEMGIKVVNGKVKTRK